MRHITLVGMNHREGHNGLLPRTITCREKHKTETIQKLFDSGFQNVLLIKMDSSNPLVFSSPEHGRIVDIA